MRLKALSQFDSVGDVTPRGRTVWAAARASSLGQYIMEGDHVADTKDDADIFWGFAVDRFEMDPGAEIRWRPGGMGRIIKLDSSNRVRWWAEPRLK